MTRTALLRHFAFAAGLAVLGWTAAVHAGGHPLALAVTAVITAVYLAGAVELWRFQRDTDGLARALDTVPSDLPALAPWLDRVPVALQPAVRLRVEGERAALPGPALAPTLTGLLVLLGMLGTFLGMVATLKGTGAALDAAADVQALRESLAAPVRGLGLAFGSSVAGVAASAMLGLMSALVRRDRAMLSRRLDARIAASALRAFSDVQRREDGLRLLQRQADALPTLVERLGALVASVERQGEALQRQLTDEQARFHRQAEAAYGALAASVDRSLQTGLRDAARAAGEAVQPMVQATLAGLARETAGLNATLAEQGRRQLEGVSAALADHGRALQASLAESEAIRLAAWQAALADMASQLDAQWRRAGDDGLARQRALAEGFADTARDLAYSVEAQGRQTLAEVQRLLQAAEQAPRAAAEVMAELRQRLADGLQRDNALLDERSRILGTVDGLVEGVSAAAAEQRAAIEALVASSAALLERSGRRLDEQVDAQAHAMSQVAAQLTGSAVEVASLGEAFGGAVQRFAETNDRMADQLQRVEAALSASLARSDEQLAYYVAQAREVIDLSLASQQQIVQDLQRLAGRQAAPAAAQAA
ncbi:hypothetical protein [Aquabacterium sp. J223]|uniref:hypothetical protein n=1 Tax=Aquabacterium sp. J223 TaxID=2898431 RepID=UPI0021ADE779|nr:hypothetical protein [Aquabacterium sp. J223]UUX96171.1 hypothetical protein LRS07_02220 [Aquabacterium sp. J223]